VTILSICNQNLGFLGLQCLDTTIQYSDNNIFSFEMPLLATKMAVVRPLRQQVRKHLNFWTKQGFFTENFSGFEPVS